MLSDGSHIVASDLQRCIHVYALPLPGTLVPPSVSPIGSLKVPSKVDPPPLPVFIDQSSKYVLCGGIGSAWLSALSECEKRKEDDTVAQKWTFKPIDLCHGEHFEFDRPSRDPERGPSTSTDPNDLVLVIAVTSSPGCS